MSPRIPPSTGATAVRRGAKETSRFTSSHNTEVSGWASRYHRPLEVR
jgi:hypothetical protein